MVLEPTSEILAEFNRSSTPYIATNPSNQTTTYEYDEYNKLTEITHPDSATEILSYDYNGQLTRSEKSTGETTTYEWNDQGMLVKVILPNSEPVEYQYDGNQRLTGRISDGGHDQFVQSGWDIVMEKNSNSGNGSNGSSNTENSSTGNGNIGVNNTGSRKYYTGMSSIDGTNSSGDRYLHFNLRRDTVLIINANGEILHNLSCEAYGKATNK